MEKNGNLWHFQWKRSATKHRNPRRMRRVTIKTYIHIYTEKSTLREWHHMPVLNTNRTWEMRHSILCLYCEKHVRPYLHTYLNTCHVLICVDCWVLFVFGHEYFFFLMDYLVNWLRYVFFIAKVMCSNPIACSISFFKPMKANFVILGRHQKVKHHLLLMHIDVVNFLMSSWRESWKIMGHLSTWWQKEESYILVCACIYRFKQEAVCTSERTKEIGFFGGTGRWGLLPGMQQLAKESYHAGAL